MPDIIEIVVLLALLAIAAMAGFAVMRMRARLAAMADRLAEAQLTLQGANNRLEQARSRVTLLSNTDPVTGLLVRHVIVERFQLSLALSHAQHTLFGVVLIQLTEFEDLADLHGRMVADNLVTVVAERRQAAMSETDTVGRVREHEFAILVPVLSSEAQMTVIADNLRERLLAPIRVPGLKDQFRLTIHVGSGTYPRDGENWISLFKRIDERLRTSRITAGSADIRPAVRLRRRR